MIETDFPKTQEEYLEYASLESIQTLINMVDSLGSIKIIFATTDSTSEIVITSTVEELKILQVSKKLDRG